MPERTLVHQLATCPRCRGGMEKGVQRRETQQIPWRTNSCALCHDTYPNAVRLTRGLQSPVLLKLGFAVAPATRIDSQLGQAVHASGEIGAPVKNDCFFALQLLY